MISMFASASNCNFDKADYLHKDIIEQSTIGDSGLDVAILYPYDMIAIICSNDFYCRMATG